MKSWTILLAMLTSGVVNMMGQGMAANPPAGGAPGRITQAAVWQPPTNFVAQAHNVCDKSMGAASFPECFINQMSVAGASAEAVAFARAINQQSGQVGILTAFKACGKVDAAQVFYPLRANDNYGLLLVNGDPQFLDVDDMKKLDQAAMNDNPMFQAVKQRFPKADVWPGDRSGSDPWPRVQASPDGGQAFIVTYPLINGCHACERAGSARFSWNFDGNGKFLKTTYVPTPPHPKLLGRHGPPPPQQQ